MTRDRHRCGRLAAVVAAALALMPICVAHADTLRIGVQGDVAALDPHILNETFSLGVLANVYEGLVRRDASLKLQPGLAVRWEKLSPLHWRFHLRRGVRFHDGSPFTADDVVFSFERAQKPRSQMQGRLTKDMRFVAVDTHTVDVRLQRANPTLHHDWENLPVMPRQWAVRHGLEEPGAPVTTEPRIAANGTGPYRITGFRPGAGATFVRNRDWWGDEHGGDARGGPDRVALYTIKDPQTRTAALFAGQVDVIVPAPVQDLARIESAAGFQTVREPELRTIFLNMDQMRDTLIGARDGTPNPFRDRRVREAVYRAIDIDVIRRVVMRGLAAPAASLVSPLVLPEIKGIARLAFSPDRARALLAEAGYPKGFSVEMDCPNDRYVNDEAICLAVSQMLARVGVRVHLNAQPKSLFYKKVLAGGGYASAFNLLGWTPGSHDAWGVLHNVARCRDSQGNGARFNLGGYCNGDVDRLTKQALGESDPAQRTAMLIEAFRRIHEDVGFIPLHQQMLAWAMSDSIQATVRADNQIRFSAIRRVRAQQARRDAQR